MKIRIIENSFIAKNILKRSITLYPFICLQGDIEICKEQKILNHEWIHVEQIRKDGFMYFYLKYFKDYCVNLFKFGFSEKSYEEIPYEKEAYLKMNSFKLPEVLE